MNRLYTVLLILLPLLISRSLSAQCPSPMFNAPDSACKGSPVLFTNTSTGSNLKYEWDFNANDLSFVPAGGLIGTYATDLSSTTGMDFLKEGSNYIAICLKASAGLERLEFGTSLNNAPVITNFGDLGGTITGPNFDLKLYKEDDQYYGLFYNAFGQMTRLSFGTSLMNTPTASPVTIPGGLFQTAYNMDLAKMGNDVVAVIANISGGYVSVINFGASITNNTPNCYNIPVPGSNPITTALVNDCGHLYAFVGHVSASPFSIIDFGTAITQTPVQILNFTNPTNFAYRKIHVIKEGARFMLIGNTYAGDLLHTFDLGTSPNNVNPVWVNHGSIGAFASGVWAFALRNIDSEISGISCNNTSAELYWFKFPQTGNINPTYSTLSNPSVSFNDPGKYYYSLTITDTVTGNSTSLSDSIIINDSPTASFINTPGCSGSTTTFLSNSTGNPTQSIWDFDNGFTGTGGSASTVFSSTGNYDVSLTVINTYGCSDTLINTVTVNDRPAADFLFANNQCAGADITFTDNSTTSVGTISSQSWYFSPTDSADGFQSTFSFNSDGLYPVTLYVEASTGCSDTITKTITIIPGPIASYEVSQTCIGDVTQFNNSTTITGGLNVNYTWIFSVNDTSYIQNPSYSFPSGTPGDYPVLLTATATNGCIDTITKNIHIGTPATVYFSVDDDTICSNNSILLNDTSIIPVGETVVRRIWDFGDGQTDSILTSLSHLYTTAGTYTLTLTIQTAENCIATYSRPLIVVESPTADFNFTNECKGIEVAFTDASTSSSITNLTNWNWSFGDTNTSSLQNPLNTYSDSGSYTITLTAIDNNGCFDSIQKSIQIYPTPVVNFSYSKACTNNEIIFTDSTTINGTTITNWEWNFGNGNTSTGSAQPTNIFTLSAAYPVTLISTSAEGCKDSITRFVAVDYSPEYQINSSTACFGTPNLFSFSYTGNVISNPGYIWNFGDSSSSLQGQPNHTYSTPGQKTVIFTLTNINNGCSITDTLIADVLTNPNADFITDSVCSGQTMNLFDSSISPDDPITAWKWTSTLPITTASQNQTFLTSTPGTYSVKLVVSTSFGCKDSITQNAEVLSLPITDFTPDPDFGSPPLIVNFTNNSDAGTYSWDFGDGSAISTSTNPTHTFSDTGEYEIKLITTSPYGCVDSTTSSINVLLPYIDLAIESSSIVETPAAYEIVANLRNLGNITVNNFRLKANLQGMSPIAEFINNAAIEPGQAIALTLNTKFLKEQFQPEFICIEIIQVNQGRDSLTSNNKSCNTLENAENIFNIYPNPTSGQFIIPIYIIKDTDFEISIHDTYGKLVRSEQTLMLPSGFNQVDFNITDLASGSYVLTIKQGENKTFKRIVKR
jgi:PKD repeat protein